MTSRPANRTRRRKGDAWPAEAEKALQQALTALYDLDGWVGAEDGPDPMPPHDLLRRHSQAIVACELALGLADV